MFFHLFSLENLVLLNYLNLNVNSFSDLLLMFRLLFLIALNYITTAHHPIISIVKFFPSISGFTAKDTLENEFLRTPVATLTHYHQLLLRLVHGVHPLLKEVNVKYV